MSGAGLLARLFGSPAPPRTGQAPAEDTPASRIAPPLEAPSPRDDAVRGESGRPGRRQRPLAPPREILIEVLSEKVLNGWLQNRHQTLYPLTVNLGRLDAGHARLLARVMAAVLLAGAPGADGPRVASSLAWLSQAGGRDEVGQALQSALEAPEPLASLLREVQSVGLTAYAYVVAIVATDPRDDAGQRFLDYLAARLALPTNVVRSADRRYRRRQEGASSVRPASAS